MKHFKYIMNLVGLMAILTSCSKDFVNLNNPNPDQQTTATFWKTSNDAVAGINAVYSTLMYDGLYMRLHPWLMDVRADDMYNTSPWWSLEVSMYTYTPGDPMAEEPWQYNYIGIFRANQVLNYVPSITMDATLKSRILGEAKFLRGLFYYHLVTIYKNVAVVTKLPASAADYIQNQVPDSVTWKQIISDFSDAMEALPIKGAPGTIGADLGRATKGAAAAFLAKSYMTVQQWGKAGPILKNIIDKQYGVYELMPNYRSNFTTVDSTHFLPDGSPNPEYGTVTSNNRESLFEIQFTKTDSITGKPLGGTALGWVGDPQSNWSKTDGYARGISPLPIQGAYGDISPTDWIYLEFQKEKTLNGKNDPRMEASLFFNHPGDPTYRVYGLTWAKANLTLRAGQTYNVHVRKYLNDETQQSEIDWRSGIPRRIMRYADVLLLYAECLNETGNTTDAYTYIQQVRKRANLPKLDSVQPGMTQDSMRMQIAHERALELCFEAQRYYDLLRWGWFTDPAKLAILISHDPEFSRYTTGREYFPIPLSERNINKNIKQNPGWPD